MSHLSWGPVRKAVALMWVGGARPFWGGCFRGRMSTATLALASEVIGTHTAEGLSTITLYEGTEWFADDNIPLYEFLIYDSVGHTQRGSLNVVDS